MSTKEDIDTENLPESPRKDHAYFEPKPPPKIIRVLTVLAYILSVSMAAILLSIYYIFMWNEQKYYEIPPETIQPTKLASSNFDNENYTVLPTNRTLEDLHRGTVVY